MPLDRGGTRHTEIGAIANVDLVGRSRELDYLVGLVARDDVRLVTITGMPGVGKTCLARCLLDAVATSGLLISLTAVIDSRLIGDALVGRLPEHNGLATSMSEALWETYRGAPVVVVLDDVDRVEGLGAVVADLLAGYPSCVVVLSAIRPTRLAGEHLVRLAPLPVPADDAGADHPTVALFVRCAAEAGTVLELSEDKVRADVIAICRQTGGLPLAIELAAARTTALPLGFIARTLWRQIGPSRQADATGGAVRRSVTEALEWAYDLLGKAARQGLSQVAVFEGPFLLDAASAVVELSEPGDDVSDALTELVDAHLLGFDTAAQGVPRFVMSELVRAFASGQLDADAIEQVRQRHARYFLDRCRAGGDIIWREWADIAVALDHELRRGSVDDALAAAIAAAPAVQNAPGATASLQARLDVLLDADAEASPELRARALLWSTALHPHEADDLASVGMWTAQRFAEATALARESGDGPALLEALEMTVGSLNITLDMAAAVSAAHEGRELARRLEDQRALARFEGWVAMAARIRGNVTETARLATSAVVRGRQHDDAVAVINGSCLLLQLPDDLRPDLDPPLPDLRSLLAECERAGQPFVGMTVLIELARESLASGDSRGAAGWLWRQLLVAADRERSEPLATLVGVTAVASLALRTGDLDAAVRLRESVRPLEPMLQYCVPPPTAAAYARGYTRLTELVPDDTYASLAAEVAGCPLRDANRHAQTVARTLARVAAPQASQPKRAGGVDPLTPREREVLLALASGATNREIAAQFGLSVKTVMHHSVAIYRKLGVRGRAAATAWAYRDGLVSRPPTSGN